VDPVLRVKIWDMLRDMVSRGATVIVTTHYMEEAARADKVGLMRAGRMLREGSPQDVKRDFGVRDLDEVKRTEWTICSRFCSRHFCDFAP